MRKTLISRANTERAMYIPQGEEPLSKTDTNALLEYIEELRQQAKWDAEKCAKQQSKNI